MLNVNALGLPFKPLVCNHPAPVMDGCVLYLDGRYGSNDPATQTWYDLSGMGNDGTLNNFAFTGTSGWSGKGLGFDGVDDYVDCGRAVVPTGDFTITALCDVKSFASGFRIILGQYLAGDTGRFWFGFDGTTFGYQIGDNSQTVPAQLGLQYLSMTKQGAEVKLYVNGELKNTSTVANEVLQINAVVGAYDATNGYFDGIIHNIFVYNRALSPREIAQNYLAGRCIMPLRHIDNATTPAEILQNELAAKFCPLFHDHYNTAGVEWEVAQSTKMTRLGTTVNKTAGSDFDSIYPYSEIKLCNVNDNGEITAYIGDSGFKRDGTNGQVMVKIPKFYYRHVYGEAAKKHQFWISEHPISGFKLHPAFMRAGVEKECIYMGAYKASIDTSITKTVTVKGENGEDKTLNVNALASVSGALPAVQKKRYEFRASAKARGDNWCIVDALARNAVALLYLVEYADTNSQSAIGQGITGLRYNAADTVTVASIEPGHTIIVSDATAGNFSTGQIIDVGTSLGGRQVCKDRKITGISAPDGDNNVTITVDGEPFSTAVGNIIYHVGQKTGGCDGLGNASGSVNYRGLEDLWGNVWEFVDGINIKCSDKEPYIADDNSKFADDTFMGVYTSSGITLPADKGYVKDFACSAKADWLLMPSIVGGGSNSTYIPDYYYQNWGNSADKVALVGGRWNNGPRAGLFYWTVDNASSYAYLNVGARLLLIP